MGLWGRRRGGWYDKGLSAGKGVKGSMSSASNGGTAKGLGGKCKEEAGGVGGTGSGRDEKKKGGW